MLQASPETAGYSIGILQHTEYISRVAEQIPARSNETPPNRSSYDYSTGLDGRTTYGNHWQQETLLLPDEQRDHVVTYAYKEAQEDPSYDRAEVRIETMANDCVETSVVYTWGAEGTVVRSTKVNENGCGFMKVKSRKREVLDDAATGSFLEALASGDPAVLVAAAHEPLAPEKEYDFSVPPFDTVGSLALSGMLQSRQA